MMKKTLLSSAIATALLAATSAQAGVSMNLGATSNYLWRGITQTSDKPAISGGIDYSHDSGFYAGAWVSNVDWTEDSSTPTANQVANYETDLYLGFSGEFSEFSYDVGYIYYAYPIDGAGNTNNAVKADFGEIYGILGWKMLNLSLYKQVNQEAGGNHKNEAYYVSLDGSWDLGNNYSVKGLVGYYGGNLVKDTFGDKYTHFSVGVTKSTDLGDLSLELSKVSGLNRSYGTAPNTTTNNYADPRVVVSWSKEF